MENGLHFLISWSIFMFFFFFENAQNLLRNSMVAARGRSAASGPPGGPACPGRQCKWSLKHPLDSQIGKLQTGETKQDGFKLVRGNGPTNIPQNIPCPFYTKASDQFGPIKCQRILCRCSTANDCAPYKPHWSKGPLICCAGACVLGQPDNCQRDSRVCN